MGSLKIRNFPEYNYRAIWNPKNHSTVRVGSGIAKELPPDKSEFYDIGLGTKCSGGCDFCYVGATPGGRYFDKICETWEAWMSTMDENSKPFQIVCGSSSEPTEHPDFCKFLETVYKTDIIPNYTTNGIIIASDTEKSREIIEATEKYVGGVAISFGNPALRKSAEKAIEKLEGKCKINIHHIISTRSSVDDFIEIAKKYEKTIYYNILLPLMPAGRSKAGMDKGIFTYLEDKIIENDLSDNVAFGANFSKYLETSKIKVWAYPPESFSKNIFLDNMTVTITPSSFDLTPIKIIKCCPSEIE